MDNYKALDSDTSVHGGFFGQSSFASVTKVLESSVVNVTDLHLTEDDLKLYAPLGCGVMTGSATVLNLAKASEDDVVVVIGLGGVGLSAIIAAKIAKSKTIIGIDLFPKRLELATALGASQVIQSSKEMDIAAEVRKLVPEGANIVVDCTGVVACIEAGIAMAANRGQVIMVGIPPPGANIKIEGSSYLSVWPVLGISHW